VTVRLLAPLFVMVTPITAEVVVDGVFGKVIAVVESPAVGGEMVFPDEPDEHPASRERKTTDTASAEMRRRKLTPLKLAELASLAIGQREISWADQSRNSP
jgi:hypothetical protein